MYFGAAYQLNTKTVLRGGIGISYYRTAMNGYNSLSTGSQNIYRGAVFGDPPFTLGEPPAMPGREPPHLHMADGRRR